MILGIGTDVVQVSRFERWRKYKKEQLLRIFSPQELNDCFVEGVLNIEKLASRFAAKEAFFKAFSQMLVRLQVTRVPFSFLFACHSTCKVSYPVNSSGPFLFHVSNFFQKLRS